MVSRGSARGAALVSAVVAAFSIAATVRPRPTGRPGGRTAGDDRGAPDDHGSSTTLCRACGWDLGEPGWTESGPHYVVCDCCAAESGVDDVSTAHARAYRRRWIEHGAVWFDPAVRPDHWDLYAQLSTLEPAGALEG
ncbi:hypothetical protein [Cellulomonas sp. PhB143]|uniref:hypothetical protein n=1 Tax=Cellulomonas sp. PhB143 TaxID=2485186 RepID=UPI000F4754FE|nr:hypothetical protein [Cellulomonas sp. PhB143]ROS79067.1 hypothetical protein EDF32_0113 [Cellulomonas sp. PhB143]